MSGSNSQPPRYLSSPSANALISDLRPTSLSPLALSYINAFLDELLCALISAAGSINPIHLRLQGVPAVFTSDRGAGESTGIRALGRAAVGEAEVELRSWYEGRPMAKGSLVGFAPDGKGRGLTAEKEKLSARFPMDAGIELLRLKAATFCTLAPQTSPSKAWETQVTAAWKNAGGDVSDETVAPAGLWLTAIIEHVCEHILSQLSRVVARDSSITVASVEDLYTALCEDESIYGMFKRMRMRDGLETAVRTGERTKRGTPQRSGTLSRALGQASPSNSPRDSKGSFENISDFSPSRKSTVPSLDGRASMENFRPQSSLKGKHERTPSVLSNTTKSILTAFQDEEKPSRGSSDRVRATLEDEEDFDALIRSGETMKVSLTPSRLKTFETPSPRHSHVSQMGSPEQVRTPRSAQQAGVMAPPSPVPEPAKEEELSPLLPTSVLPSTSDLMNRGSGTSSPVSAAPQPPATNRPPASRMRSSNSLKLIPRDATIEEKEEVDEESPKKSGPGSPKQAQGQSLMEILKSEIQDERSRKKSKASISQAPPRTVPAVIVGSPPPPPRSDAEKTLLQVPSSNGQAPKPATTPPSSYNPPASNDDPKGSTQPLRISRNKPAGSPASQTSTLPGTAGTTGSVGKKPKSVNRDAMDDDDDAAADALGNLKPRSAARELADFLNTTPPPEPAPAKFSDDSSSIPEQPRKGSFKSLMSKMTGGSSSGGKKGKDETSSPVPQPTKNVARFDDPPTVRTHMLDRQVSPSQPSPRGAAASLKGVLRKPSAPVDPSLPQDKLPMSAGMAAGTAAVAGMVKTSGYKNGTNGTNGMSSKTAVPPQVQAVNASPRMSPTTTSTSTAAALGNAPPPVALEPAVSVPPTNTSVPPASSGSSATANGLSDVFRARGMQIQDEHIGPNVRSVSPAAHLHPLEISPHSQAPATMPMGLPVPMPEMEAPSPSQPVSATVDQPTAAQAVPPAEMVKGNGVEGPALASDDHSFKTADEGEDMSKDAAVEAVESAPAQPLEAVGESTSDTATPQPPASQATFPNATSAFATSHPLGQGPAPGASIPLSDLVSLRNLLDHATSARECRLLLNAILTQWGVPGTARASISSEAGGKPRPLSMPSPEDRVTAWLLAGREGPVLDGLGVGAVANGEAMSSGSNNSRWSGADEQVVTPIQRQPGLPNPVGTTSASASAQAPGEPRDEDIRARANRLFSVGALASKSPDVDSGAFVPGQRASLGAADILSQVDETDEEGTVVTGPMIPSPQGTVVSRFGNGPTLVV